MVLWITILIFALMWGSFLNVVACRLINNLSIITPRSHCYHCKKTIAWYDNIPVLSWILLRGKCRNCKDEISFLYPLIELLTAGSFVLLYLFRPEYFFGYAIFFSALIVTVRTDLEHMLISRLATIGMLPCAWILSYFGMLPITLWESLIGTLIGYASLWIVAHLFYLITKKHGLGEGDFDLLALIGAFCGIEGVCIAVFVGSWIGTVISIGYIITSRKNLQVKIPFGLFLALGAMCYVVLQNDIHRFFLFMF